MGFLDKMKNVLGNSKPSEETIDSNYIEDIINSVENIPFAASQSNVLYAGISELAGYHYFKTVVVGTFKLKTHKGAQMTIVGEDFKFVLNSDMMEIESEASNVPNQFVTNIDFEIEEEDIPKIVKSKITSLKLSAKKEHIPFTILEITHEESIIEVDVDGEEEEE